MDAGVSEAEGDESKTDTVSCAVSAKSGAGREWAKETPGNQTFAVISSILALDGVFDLGLSAVLDTCPWRIDISTDFGGNRAGQLRRAMVAECTR
jgi:hypothetical protein